MTETDPMTWAEGRLMTFARSLGRCEARMAPDCRDDAVEHHHRQRRRIGDHRPSNGLTVCRPCHQHVHAHPEQSKALGFIVPPWADPAAESVLLHPRGEYRSVLVYLTEGGTYL